MTANEQLLVELINRARTDPTAEVNRYSEIDDLNDNLSPGTITATPKQPLAPHQALINASVAHSQDMLVRDYFSHTNLQNKSPSDRARAAGYPAGVGENIAWGGSTGSINQIDHVFARHKALFLSAGHRRNIMGENYRELGVGVRYGVFTTSRNWNASMVTENFGSRSGNPFLTGVAYTDTGVDDDFYTIGEGAGGVLVAATNDANGRIYTTTTGNSGGYTLQLPSGTYTVVAVGGNMNGEFRQTGVQISTTNVKFDVVTTEPTGPVTTNGVAVVSLNDGTLWQSESIGFAVVTSQWTGLPAIGGWQDVQTGDFDGDGNDDVIGRRADGQWYVTRIDSGTTVTEQWGSWSSRATWSHVKVADVDDDGLDDIVGRANNGHWWVARSTGTSLQNQNWGIWSTNVTWDHVNVGDFDGDGDDDIVGRARQSGAWWVARSTGTAFVNELWGRWSKTIPWRHVKVGDFDGNGSDDVIGQTSGNWWVARSNGTSFVNQRWGRWSTQVQWVDVNVADVNGDGRTDLVGRTGGNWWVGLSQTSAFVNERWGRWSPSLTWTDVRIADLDDDGSDDIVGRTGDRWWVSRSNGQAFETREWGQAPSDDSLDAVLTGKFS